MPLFPTTFASPIELTNHERQLNDVESGSTRPAATDVERWTSNPHDQRLSTARARQLDKRRIESGNPSQLLYWSMKPSTTNIDSGNKSRSSPVVASSSPNLSQHGYSSSSSSSKRSSQHDRLSNGSSTTTAASSTPPMMVDDHDNMMKRHHDTSPLIASITATQTSTGLPHVDHDMNGAPDAPRQTLASSRTVSLQRRANNASPLSSGVAIESNGTHGYHDNTRAYVKAQTGLGFDLGANWSTGGKSGLVEIDEIVGQRQTYSSDLGSGVSSQSTSPNTSPSVAAIDDGQQTTSRVTLSPNMKRQQAHFLDHQVQHHERTRHVRTSPVVELEPEHIVFDVPVTTKQRRNKRYTQHQNISSVSSQSSPHTESSSPALSSPNVERRVSVGNATSQTNMNKVNGHKVYFPPPPSHISPRPAPVFSFLPTTTSTLTNNESKVRKLASKGPFPSTSTFTQQRTKKGSIAMKKSFSNSPKLGSIFPSSPRVQPQQQRRHSTLEPTMTWDKQDGDELDWLMEASARTVDNHPMRVLMNAQQDEQEDDDDDQLKQDAIDSDVIDQVFNEARHSSLDHNERDESSVLKADSTTMAGDDKDSTLQQWVLDQIATNAVGDANWRRMSAIGEEADEESELDERVQSKLSIQTTMATSLNGPVLDQKLSMNERNVKNLSLAPLSSTSPNLVQNVTLSTPSMPTIDTGLSTPCLPTQSSPRSPQQRNRSTPGVGVVSRSPSSRPASITSQSSVRSRLSARFSWNGLFGHSNDKTASMTFNNSNRGISSDSVRHLMDAIALDESCSGQRLQQHHKANPVGGDDHDKVDNKEKVEEEEEQVELLQDDQVVQVQPRSKQTSEFENLLEQFQQQEQIRLKRIAQTKLDQRREKLERRRGSLEKADNEMRVLIEEGLVPR
ncbi:hypothetical protein OIO90_006130 [Microbotryomycetes sp. JL221]|nr:hypothetical protein OIO90_006130 [Microbotryomycetes sp. JL221]